MQNECDFATRQNTLQALICPTKTFVFPIFSAFFFGGGGAKNSQNVGRRGQTHCCLLATHCDEQSNFLWSMKECARRKQICI